jgi:hypothetical protein
MLMVFPMTAITTFEHEYTMIGFTVPENSISTSLGGEQELDPSTFSLDSVEPWRNDTA